MFEKIVEPLTFLLTAEPPDSSIFGIWGEPLRDFGATLTFKEARMFLIAFGVAWFELASFSESELEDPEDEDELDDDLFRFGAFLNLSGVIVAIFCWRGVSNFRKISIVSFWGDCSALALIRLGDWLYEWEK